jgi:glyoxylase-like metal-dependent hydrolase (beta-lactamase superfamily II)/rhodanese-related sulfurtransferase
MFFRQVYLGCLAQASYVLGDEGEAVVVDPRRDVAELLAAAAAEDLAVRNVVATHTHADFVAGHRELAAATGATVWLGPGAGAAFPHRTAAQDEVLHVGRLDLRFLETPGHTHDSLCILVQDRTGRVPPRLLSGDTLFVGDVGRPDLVGGRGGSAAEMAERLFDSLHERILALDDATEVWPAHGAGSACGKNIGSESSSTIGHQRRTNLMLQLEHKGDFVRELLRDLQPPPRYFAHAARANRAGPRLLGELPPLVALAGVPDGALVLDVRSAAAHGAGHPPLALNVGASGMLEHWCGTLLDPAAPLVVLADDAAAAAAVRVRLARVGLENVAGFVTPAGGPPATATLPQADVHSLAAELARDPGLQVLDVRRPREFEAGHVPGAHNAPLAELDGHAVLARLDRDRPVAIVCQTGYRSSIAAHFLRKAGFAALCNVTGGTSAWLQAGLPVERG